MPSFVLLNQDTTLPTLSNRQWREKLNQCDIAISAINTYCHLFYKFRVFSISVLSYSRTT